MMLTALSSATTLLASLALATTEGREPLGEVAPYWTVAPFAVMLLAIAILPLALPHFWHTNRNRSLVSLGLGLPVVAVLVFYGYGGDVLHIGHEYIAFIILLGALFTISGGIVVRGTLAGTPAVNTLILAIGAVLASFIGTTGAAMLLIRPLLRANAIRQRKTHVVVFFIFLVANIGGLLTPLGDPPLFLGFLRGVPFFWTMRLFPSWAFMCGVLLVVFFIVDSIVFRREDVQRPGDLDEMAEEATVPLHILGKVNFLLLGGVVLTILACGHYKPPIGVQEAGMILMAGLSLWLTPKVLRKDNGFTWGPIVEVAVVFAGIFATMIPALAILNARGADLGVTQPWQFFWATGLLSSFLDNAPTYLTFTSTASGLVGTDANFLAQLLDTELGPGLLRAISLGAVFMGANTYIGNGPNFMVKAVAEEAGVKMPSFFGYMAYTLLILMPLFALFTWLFIL